MSISPYKYSFNKGKMHDITVVCGFLDIGQTTISYSIPLHILWLLHSPLESLAKREYMVLHRVTKSLSITLMRCKKSTEYSSISSSKTYLHLELFFFLPLTTSLSIFLFLTLVYPLSSQLFIGSWDNSDSHYLVSRIFLILQPLS